MKSLALLCLFSLTTLSTVSAANWPSWRGGADGSGIVSAGNVVSEWSDTKNVRWRVPLPDRGNSTPVVWGNRIFVSQAIEKENRRTLMCFDRADGRLLWQSGVVYAEPEQTHRTNPYCSASPVTDGERVIVTHASAGVFCYDFEGRELWKRDLGRQSHEWGNASSPVLYGELCILYHGPGPGAFMLAMDKRTGKAVWRYDEPVIETGDRTDGFKGRSNGVVGSFSTPIIIRANGRDELIMSFPGFVRAFDPKTGKQLWWCGGLNPLVYTSPIAGEGVVVAMGGFLGTTIAVKAGGNGDVTQTHRLWQSIRTKNRLGSGVIKDGHVYILNTEGIAECIELKTGKVIWEERLKGSGAKGESWSSMNLVGDLIYTPNQTGDVLVLRASPKFEFIGLNSVKEPTNSSLAFANGDIILRTHESLWCIGRAPGVAAIK